MTNNRTQQNTYLHFNCEQRKPKSGISSNLSGNGIVGKCIDTG